MNGIGTDQTIYLKTGDVNCHASALRQPVILALLLQDEFGIDIYRYCHDENERNPGENAFALLTLLEINTAFIDEEVIRSLIFRTKVYLDNHSIPDEYRAERINYERKDE